MDDRLRREILEANIAMHKDEAALYDRIHPELNNADEQNRLGRLLDLAMPKISNGRTLRALDLGAGTGFVTEQLLQRGFHVDAVDISAEMIQRLSVKQPEAVKAETLKVAVQDADTYLDHAETYDLITASSVLHHFPDYAATITRMTKHLAPGGSLVFFHEPTSGKVSAIEMFLRRVDWKLAHYFLISKDDLAMLKKLNLQYDMADYHVTHGFDEHKVQETLTRGGNEVVFLDRYATAQTGLIRFIFKWCFPPSTWSMVARPRA